jgi:hypothetical protein
VVSEVSHDVTDSVKALMQRIAENGRSILDRDPDRSVAIIGPPSSPPDQGAGEPRQPRAVN